MNAQTYTRVNIRPTTAYEKDLPWYDSTKLTAINTCPTYGILRYKQHKVNQESRRELALHAGEVSHQFFAALRIWQLMNTQKLPDHADVRGQQMFTIDRYKELLVHKNEALNFALTALHTSGYYDDPQDRRRTMANIEQACISYYDRWNMERYPVWVQDKNDPVSMVGIEIAIDVIIEYHDETSIIRTVRYIGKMDGLHHDRDFLCIHENKTASRMDDSWRLAWKISHQITGYCVGGSIMTQLPINRCLLIGMQIPQPKIISEGIVYEPISRGDHNFARWLQWIWHTVSLVEQYEGDVRNAPKYSHSCNRYFRACSFIPFCYADDDEQLEILEHMDTEEWHPHDDAAT